MMIRTYFLLTVSYFISCSFPLFSQSDEPYVAISPKVLVQLAGVGASTKLKGVLTCSGLLTKTWAYPDAQVTPFCYDAETACMRHDLLKQEAHKGQGMGAEISKATIAFSHEDATMKLLGCKVALEAMMIGSSIILPPVGGYAPLLNLVAPSSTKH